MPNEPTKKKTANPKGLPDRQADSASKPNPQASETSVNAVRPTGLPQLDFILHGGFPTNATVLLAGASGTGKTILATQWLFEGYDQFKEPGLYISLTEPITKAITNASKMSFFKQEYVNPLQIYFTDLRGIMKGLELENKEFTREDIAKLIGAIENMVVQSKAKRVVLDSVTAMAYRLKSKDLIREFIFQLGTLLAQTEANVIMTSEVVGEGYSVFGVEEFISDGIIKLYHERAQMAEYLRKLEIIKMRGSSYDSHPASYRITGDGMFIFPRLSRKLEYKVSDERVLTGVPGLDAMTGGGYFEGSSILLTGASGTGKTIIAMQFLKESLSRGEKVIYVSFEESHDQLVRNAKTFGWDFAKYEKEGLLKVLASYPEELYLEEHMSVIEKAVEEFGAKRLVIDSLSSLGNAFSPEVVRDFTSRIIGFLKEQKVTTLFTVATDTLMGSGSITDSRLSTITDHIIMLRYVEIQSELRHALLILKMRGSAHDKKMKELVFSSDGVLIASSFSGYEGVISGITRKVGKAVEDQLHDLFVEILGPMGEKIFAEEKEKGLNLASVKKLMKELGSQGIISERRKAEFVERAEIILGKGETPKNENKEEAEEQSAEPMDIDKFLHLSDNK